MYSPRTTASTTICTYLVCAFIYNHCVFEQFVGSACLHVRCSSSDQRVSVCMGGHAGVCAVCVCALSARTGQPTRCLPVLAVPTAALLLQAVSRARPLLPS